jgi:hypothetical protein
MSRRIKSLQLRLTVELGALFLAASCLALGGLIYSASLTAGSVADRELVLRAEDIARYVSLDESKKPRLDLPPGVQQAYSAAAQQSAFAIRDRDGQLIAASSPEIGAIVARWPPADSEPNYFRLGNFGPSTRDYSGVSIKLDSAAGPLSVTVAEASGGDQLVHSILREFVFDIAWYVPPFVAVALMLARLDSVVLDCSSSVDLRQIAEEVVGSMAHLALAAGRTIALTGADHPVIVIGNAAAITDALRNLIENAFAHTPPGTEVVVEVDPTGAISVQDSGAGVPAEDRPRIFERFWRGKGVRTDGAGLGLAIVMEIARAHGASVTVSNRIPRGARFDVRFRAA